MRTIFRTLALLATTTLAAPVLADTPDPRQLLDDAQTKGTPQTIQSTMTMTLTDAGGRSSSRELELRKVGEEKQVVWFTRPVDLRGTAFLRLEQGGSKQMWLYLPGFRQLDRISGARENESFLGSDFTYADMGTRNLDEYTHRYLGTGTLDGTDTHKIESSAKQDDAPYERIVSFLRVEDGRLLREDLYDALGDLVKRKVHERFETVGKYYMPAVVIMTDMVTGHSTRLETRNIKVDEELSDRMFTTQYIQRIRP